MLVDAGGPRMPDSLRILTSTCATPLHSSCCDGRGSSQAAGQLQLAREFVDDWLSTSRVAVSAAAYQFRIKGLLFRLSPGVRVQARPTPMPGWLVIATRSDQGRSQVAARAHGQWPVRKFLIEGDDDSSAHVPGIQLVFT